MDKIETTLLSQGGPVMWVLLVMSVLGFVFFVERALYLHRGQIKAVAFVEGVKNLLSKKRRLEALTVCEETPGPVASVVKAALLSHEDKSENMRLAIEEAAIVQIPQLERRISSVLAIAKLAPLLGLFGTLLAMMSGFREMSAEQGYADASGFSALMTAAMVTTATGLLISILAHLAHHFLMGRVKSILHDMEWSANRMIEYLLYEYNGIGERSTDKQDNDTSK